VRVAHPREDDVRHDRHEHREQEQPGLPPQPGGRLVEHDLPRVTGEREGEPGPLRLAAGQPVR
jgi:hypothetical protein